MKNEIRSGGRSFGKTDQLRIESETRAGTAVFSDCGRYRYTLTRRWDESRETTAFVMLNPSTATAEVDDPTIRRCIGFAKAWGSGGVEIYNLFALRSTDPRALKVHPDPVGPENDRHLFDLGTRAAKGNGRIVLAYGVWGGFLDRDLAVVQILRGCGARLSSLGTTSAGKPRHPLYLPGDLEPRDF